MAVTLTLARADDLGRLERLVAGFHASRGIGTTEDDRRAALQPLLDGVPHGVAYLVGPPRSPVGHLIVSFGWSVELGGIEGTVSELFIREGVRRRGMASEAMAMLHPALARHGVRALHVDVPADDARGRAFWQRLGYAPRDRSSRMTCRF